LGQAIRGASRGESREYILPNGRVQKGAVIDAKPFSG
jgi:transcription elongation factor GreA